MYVFAVEISNTGSLVRRPIDSLAGGAAVECHRASTALLELASAAGLRIQAIVAVAQGLPWGVLQEFRGRGGVCHSETKMRVRDSKLRQKEEA